MSPPSGSPSPTSTSCRRSVIASAARSDAQPAATRDPWHDAFASSVRVARVGPAVCPCICCAWTGSGRVGPGRQHVAARRTRPGRTTMTDTLLGRSREAAVATSVGEPERLRALHRLAVLDTPREQLFDDLVTLAAQILDV